MVDYSTPAAFESAIREAARSSLLDTNRAIELFWRDRFLNRVFVGGDDEFVLKGGLSILARINSRYTRDIDLAARDDDIKYAETRLIDLASIDLDDYFVFDYQESSAIRLDDEYRIGRRVSFGVSIGGQRKGILQIDLVVGCNPVGEPELLVPKQRLDIKGLKAVAYHLYPLEDTISDKVCAIIQQYPGNRPSSRVKDLVDLVIIVTTCVLNPITLSTALNSEARQRGITLNNGFNIPSEWLDYSYQAAYNRLASEAGITDGLSDMKQADALVKKVVDPLIVNELKLGAWNPMSLVWEQDNL